MSQKFYVFTSLLFYNHSGYSKDYYIKKCGEQLNAEKLISTACLHFTATLFNYIWNIHQKQWRLIIT